jgi:hypothetical protein
MQRKGNQIQRQKKGMQRFEPNAEWKETRYRDIKKECKYWKR